MNAEHAHNIASVTGDALHLAMGNDFVSLLKGGCFHCLRRILWVNTNGKYSVRVYCLPMLESSPPHLGCFQDLNQYLHRVRS